MKYLGVIGSLLALGLVMNYSVNAYIQITFLFVLMNALLALGLNLVNGFTGQFSLGHAGFMAVGAYFAAFASSHWNFMPESLLVVQILLFTLGSGLIAALFGYMVGLPSLRLKGDYLAIVTLGFGEIIRVALLNIESLGGARGISGIAPFPEIQIGSFVIDRFLVSYFVCMGWAALAFLLLWRIKFSQQGRAFFSIREDEMAAESMGVPTTKVKVRAFVISSFFAGVAGALYCHLTSIITPGAFTFAEKSVNAVIMVVLGGMGSLTGSVLAAVFVTVLPELLRSLQDILGVDIRMILFALTLILVMIFRPAGIMGEKEFSDIFKFNFKWKRRHGKTTS